MSGTSSDDGEAWSHARHLIYYVGMRYRSVVISIDDAQFVGHMRFCQSHVVAVSLR